VDGRDKPGHDVGGLSREQHVAYFVIASLAFFSTSFGVA
jgi:hypothetical protein